MAKLDHLYTTNPLKTSSPLYLLPPIQGTILESILVISFTIATILIIVPSDYVDGSPVPTIIFKGLSSTFHWFVISIIFAFAFALSSLLIHDCSLLARLFACSSVASIASALVILLWSSLFTWFLADSSGAHKSTITIQ
ncbi:hypothetical protein CsSME_00026624 [Camellia sinensis var. sinensis]